MLDSYPSIFDSDFTCFDPPKELSKATKEDFQAWFYEYNYMEVLRFVFMAGLNDMIYMLHYQGDEFTPEEIDSYLHDFGHDNRYNDMNYAFAKLNTFLDEFVEYSGTVSFIQTTLMVNAGDMDEDDEDCTW
jgi:hypothetical protein